MSAEIQQKKCGYLDFQVTLLTQAQHRDVHLSRHGDAATPPCTPTLLVSSA